MGSLERRLGAAEEALIDSLIVEMMVEREIRAMLQVLEDSGAIGRDLFQKVVKSLADAGYIEGAKNGA